MGNPTDKQDSAETPRGAFELEQAMFAWAGGQIPPCPFCQSSDVRAESSEWFEYGGRINCMNCGACGPVGDTPAIAAQRWGETGSPAVTEGHKEASGKSKLPLDSCPALASAEQALAHYEGDLKYGGPYSWRAASVSASTYIAAIQRHLLKWQSGRDRDPTSGAHELGHVMACCAILIDAEAHGGMVDDRQKSGEVPARFEALRSRMRECHAKLTSGGARG